MALKEIARPEAITARAQARGFSPARVYRDHFAQDPRRERMFLSSVGFFGGFGVARGITHMIKHNIGPFHNIEGKGGFHLHHMVFGITGLLGVGYLWLLQPGFKPDVNTKVERSIAVGYGFASALTLDEFALWLNLKDVYWAKQGKESVRAAFGFGAVTSIGLWGGPFLRELGREFKKLLP
ncbi:MAG TPA: hypothetical protein VF137_08775 [Candidatus Dormibacteraeota bacterium]